MSESPQEETREQQVEDVEEELDSLREEGDEVVEEEQAENVRVDHEIADLEADSDDPTRGTQ